MLDENAEILKQLKELKRLPQNNTKKSKKLVKQLNQNLNSIVMSYKNISNAFEKQASASS